MLSSRKPVHTRPEGVNSRTGADLRSWDVADCLAPPTFRTYLGWAAMYRRMVNDHDGRHGETAQRFVRDVLKTPRANLLGEAFINVRRARSERLKMLRGGRGWTV